MTAAGETRGVELSVIRTGEIRAPYGYVYRAEGSVLSRLRAGLSVSDDALASPCLASALRHPSAGLILIDTGFHRDAQANRRKDFGVPMSLAAAARRAVHDRAGGMARYARQVCRHPWLRAPSPTVGGSCRARGPRARRRAFRAVSAHPRPARRRDDPSAQHAGSHERPHVAPAPPGWRPGGADRGRLPCLADAQWRRSRGS